MEQPMMMLAAPAQSFLSSGILPMLVVFVIFYLLIFMPMRKRQKKTDEMINSIKRNDRVILSSGIYGVVADVKPKTFLIKIADQVKIEVARNAVAALQAPEETQPEK